MEIASSSRRLGVARPIAILAALLGLAVALVLPADAPGQALGELARRLGKIKTVEEGAKAFELQVKGGSLRVVLLESVTLVACEGRKLGECDGKRIHLLGRHFPREVDPQSQRTVNPRWVQIQAMVASTLYEPPPLTEDQQKRRLQWTSGTPQRPEPNRYWMNDAEVGTGPDRVVSVIEKAEAASVLKKGAMALVEGVLEEPAKGEKKALKTIHAGRVTVIQPSAPQAELPLILQMQ